MSASIVYLKELTAAEVGKTKTHEVYIRLPNDFHFEKFFDGLIEENGSVLEACFTAHDVTDKGSDETIDLRFVYFHNSNNEKRIPGLAPYFATRNVEEGDIVRLVRCEEDGESPVYYINFYKKGSFVLKPSSLYFECDKYINPFSISVWEKGKITKRGPLQIIYYGAPGTGKSFEVNELTKGYSTVRTTFHPDTDYSTFVGAYKPVMTTEDVKVVPVVIGDGGVTFNKNEGTLQEQRITYKFVRQAFLKAYLAAWKKYAEAAGNDVEPQFLVIEEINRGNCAQIFGDLFQLLDREGNGFSKYPIEADSDLTREINAAFNEEEDGEYRLADGCKIDAEGAVDKYTSSTGHTLSDDIQEGRVLMLPPNLYIWATMNTSDQSLFPIDSAFKRRWTWKYTKIAEGYKRNANGEYEKEPDGKRIRLGWQIEGNDYTLDWWTFVQAINKAIGGEGSAEDKKLGYFFCKPDHGVNISEDTFVGKVMFYLWNDVFKDSDAGLFKVTDDEPMFDAFYTEDDQGFTIVNSEAVKRFLTNLLKDKAETEIKAKATTANKNDASPDNPQPAEVVAE